LRDSRPSGTISNGARRPGRRKDRLRAVSILGCRYKYHTLPLNLKVLMNLEQQFADLHELWSPRVIGRVNDQYVKVAKLKGEFTWHRHDNEDEMFLVVKGRLKIQFEDGSIELGPGEFHIVPKGVLHNPVADEECWVMLIETVTTKHTGDVVSPLTRTIEQQLGR
jgi:mannose-6-phosphate isomerase-like protein (cupin superfamily)